MDFSGGDAVFVNFFCGVAVFRGSPCPPHYVNQDCNTGCPEHVLLFSSANNVTTSVSKR